MRQDYWQLNYWSGLTSLIIFTPAHKLMNMLQAKLTFALLTLSTLLVSGQQKTQLTFDISTAYQPDDYFFGFMVDQGFSPRKSYHLSPIVSGSLGIRDFIGRSQWFYEGCIMYNYTQVYLDWGHLTFPDQIDPYYGFVQSTTPRTTDMEIREHYHSAGLTIGAGYRWENRARNKALALSVGLKSYHTFGRKKVVSRGDDKSSSQINKNYGEPGSFADWLYYGFYLRPAFEFKLSKNRTPWRFSVFADANAMWYDNTDLGAKFLFGGGIGVRYNLQK